MTGLRGRAGAAHVAALAAVVGASLLAGCGGDGGSGGAASAPPPAPAPPPASATSIDYPNSLTLGGPTTAQDVLYVPATTTATLASVQAAAASTLLRAGSNLVIAEHTDASLPGQRVVCVSGKGDSTNVVSGINLGVIAESAAVLMDTSWSTIDAASAWTDAVGRGGSFAGWENCGVKPEGSPSASSRLVPRPDGGYNEDVYDGNPGTTFNVISRSVASTVVAAMLSPGGYATVEDPARPLVLTLRAWRNGAGNTVFVERGEPQANAPAGTRGFIALYLRTS